MERVVRLYVEYSFDDPKGTMTEEEVIQKAYDKMNEDIDHGWFILEAEEISTNKGEK